MARFHVPQLSEFPYHITARCPNREPFPIPLSEVWKLFEHHLSLVHYKYGLRIHSFVLMPNHFHLVCSTTEFPIGKVMSALLGELSKDINARAEKINQNWGGRHHKTVIADYRYSVNVYKYVYQNPLRAQICQSVELWPYSTLHGILGLSPLRIPIEPDTVLFNPNFDEKELQWLNTLPSQTDLQAVRTALSKKVFKLPKLRGRYDHELEHKRL